MRDFGALILLSVAATAAAPTRNARVEERPAAKAATPFVPPSVTANSQSAVDKRRR